MSSGTQFRAFARAGLIGNPSDGFYGRTIAVSVRNFNARVRIEESDRLRIEPPAQGQLDFANLDTFLDHVRMMGIYGGVRLIKAGLLRFAQYCRDRELPIDRRTFVISYGSDIPIRVGLGGSSAILVALFRALMRFHDVEIPRVDLPQIVLSVESELLGIGAGLQDRVIQVYEGAVFMDFDRERMAREGHGQYESIDAGRLPPLFVAWSDQLAEGTEITHNTLRERFARGDREVIETMAEIADLAKTARVLIDAGRGAEIGPLMDRNFDLRTRICDVSDGNRRLVMIGRDLGASVKLAGSGGAVIGAWTGDPRQYYRLRQAYEDGGAHIIIPEITES